MAIFLSRIKKILNLGTKSITQNGTYDASDDGYEGYSQVTVNVSATGTSITPSNASPVALTANTAVKPTTAGYAIESYSDVTPSNVSPVSLTSGDIVKLGGNGKAVASITSITPSNSPNLIGLGGIYAPTREGYVVQSVENVTPSDSSPANLLSGGIYKTNNAGVAIQSYQSFGAPSASGTPFNAGFTKWTSGGYAYPSRPDAMPDMSNPDIDESFTMAKSTTKTYQLTEAPSLVLLLQKNNGGDYINYTDIVSFKQNAGYDFNVNGGSSGGYTKTTSYTTRITFDSTTNVLTVKNQSTSFNRYCYLQVWY